MDRPKLYSGTRNASSWAMRAWLALREAEIEFDEEIVDIRSPQRFVNLAKVGSFSPPAMVPVLVAGKAVIFDSLAIMEYANDRCGGRLLPQEVVGRAKARSIMAWQHSGLSNICSRISFESTFYPFKRALIQAELTECDRLFAFLEASLGQSGGPYLCGELSLADLMLVPVVIRLSRHHPPMAAWPLVQKWTAELQSRASVTEWISDADRLPHIWFDEYLVPGQDIALTDARTANRAGQPVP